MNETQLRTYKPITPSLRQRRTLLPISPRDTLSPIGHSPIHPSGQSPEDPQRDIYKKLLQVGKRTSTNGRNNQGKITIRHRGGGHKRKLRLIDFKRSWAQFSTYIVEKIERSPNNSGFLALCKIIPPRTGEFTGSAGMVASPICNKGQRSQYSYGYILAPHALKLGSILTGTRVDALSAQTIALCTTPFESIIPQNSMGIAPKHLPSVSSQASKGFSGNPLGLPKGPKDFNNSPLNNWTDSMKDVGSAGARVSPRGESFGGPGQSLLIRDIPIGTNIYNISIDRQNQSSGPSGALLGIGKGKFTRAAGTTSVLLNIISQNIQPLSRHSLSNTPLALSGPQGRPAQAGLKSTQGSEGLISPESSQLSVKSGARALIRLPSNKIITVDGNCIASIGRVSNINNSMVVKGKAGVSRWLGLRPVVRGEAMNPVDHPHGGKSHGSGGKGNPMHTKWGKLAKWTALRHTPTRN